MGASQKNTAGAAVLLALAALTAALGLFAPGRERLLVVAAVLLVAGLLSRYWPTSALAGPSARGGRPSGGEREDRSGA